MGTTPREPETEAGRALDESTFGDWTLAIIAIEAELRAKLAVKVEGLPLFDADARTMSGAAESMRIRAARLLRGDSGGAA